MKPETKVRMTFAMLDLLDLMVDFLFLANRPGLQRMSNYWGHVEMRTAYRAFQRCHALQYVEKQLQGDDVVFRLSEKGRKLLEQRRPSAASRHRTWDGRWRMVMFDFPEVARKARDAFRRQLRQQRLGCLQKSVWISPDSIIPAWKRLLEETKLTEWVLLFESAELGPVNDVDIACRVWPNKELDQRYKRYLSYFSDLPRSLKKARPSELDAELRREIRRESNSYFAVLEDDPVLPSVLVPRDFSGIRADTLHKEVRAAVRDLVFGAGR